MLSILKKCSNATIKGLEYLLIVFTAVLVLDVIWQVFTRYVLSNASSWTEELATILLVWVSLLGASVGFIRKSHLGIDYLANKLAEIPRSVLDIAVYLLVSAFASVVMIYGGSILVSRTLQLHQTTPALGLERGYVYMVLPLSGIFILIFSLFTIVQNLLFIFTSKGRGNQ